MATISRMYENYSDAAATVHDLEEAHLPGHDISLVANADAHGRASTDSRPAHETHSGTGAATGAGIGAAVGIRRPHWRADSCWREQGRGGGL